MERAIDEGEHSAQSGAVVKVALKLLPVFFAALALRGCSTFDLSPTALVAGVLLALMLGLSIRRWVPAALAAAASLVTLSLVCQYGLLISDPEFGLRVGFIQTVIFVAPPAAILGLLGVLTRRLADKGLNKRRSGQRDEPVQIELPR